MNRKQICEQETNLRQRLKPPVDRSRTIRRKLLFYVATHNNSVDLVQKGIFADLFHMVFAVFRAIRYSKRISKKCTPWFLQYFGRLGTAVPILRFVPLDFSNMCSTITRNLPLVPKCLDRTEIYGEHLKEISSTCLKRLTKTEIHGEHFQEIYTLYLKQIHGNNFEECSCAYPNME